MYAGAGGKRMARDACLPATLALAVPQSVLELSSCVISGGQEVDVCSDAD